MKNGRKTQGPRNKGSSISNIISEKIQVCFRIDIIKLTLDETAFKSKMNPSKKVPSLTYLLLPFKNNFQD